MISTSGRLHAASSKIVPSCDTKFRTIRLHCFNLSARDQVKSRPARGGNSTTEFGKTPIATSGARSVDGAPGGHPAPPLANPEPHFHFNPEPHHTQDRTFLNSGPHQTQNRTSKTQNRTYPKPHFQNPEADFTIPKTIGFLGRGAGEILLRILII